MKIDPKRATRLQSPTTPNGRTLLRILEQPSLEVLRPCPECALPCASHASVRCTCGCHTQCERAAQSLSSDPSRYPIESKILPLVMEIAALRVCQPCWSCEGHENREGAILNLPSVWFYVDDMTVLDMFSRFLAWASAQRQLACQWHIEVVYGANDIAFSCTPNAWALPASISLISLHLDVIRLSTCIREGFHQQARRAL